MQARSSKAAKKLERQRPTSADKTAKKGASAPFAVPGTQAQADKLGGAAEAGNGQPAKSATKEGKKAGPEGANKDAGVRVNGNASSTTDGASKGKVEQGGGNSDGGEPGDASGSGEASAQGQQDAAASVASGPAIIVFGYTEQNIPQASWFGEKDAELATKAAGLMKLRVLKVESDAQREIAARLREGQVYASDRAFAPIVNRDDFNKLLLIAGPAATDGEGKGAAAPTGSRPASSAEIEAGSLVLAQDPDPAEGWWEAVVVSVTGDDVALRWRDYPRLPAFSRPRSTLALMPFDAPSA